ncbi:MAG: hypothetical protein OXH07_12635 [Chloroflexi bacterium]|nr:hypothetical protein [Chloroflexota bacterium]
MKRLLVVALAVGLLAGSGLPAAVPQADASATRPHVTIRLRHADDGRLVVERDVGTSLEARWVRIHTFRARETAVSSLLLYGSASVTLRPRRVSYPAQTGGGYRTETGGNRDCESELVREDPDGTRHYRTTCTTQHLTHITCANGLSVTIGYSDSLESGLSAGSFGLLLCHNGDYLEALDLPDRILTLDELKAEVEAVLLALPTPRTIADLRPLREGRSDVPPPYRANVEVHVAQWKSNGEVISVTARADGGDWHVLELEQPLTVELPYVFR